MAGMYDDTGMTEPTTIRSILCIGLSGVRAQITQIDGGEVEASLRGQYRLAWEKNEFQRAIDLCKQGKWEEAEAIIAPAFEHHTIIKKG